jgi:hypothetical protein
LRRVVGKLKEVAPTPTEDHLKVHRSWSSYQSLDQGERYQVKRIVVKVGRLSLQIHQHRIRGGDDDQILDPEQGDELLFGGDVACAAFPVALCADSSQTQSMRRTGRHTRINRPVAKASVHGIFFTVRLGVSARWRQSWRIQGGAFAVLRRPSAA